MTWETKTEFIKRPGWSLGKVHSKIYRKKWTLGVEYALIDGEHWIDPEAVESWITRQALDQRQAVLKSVTNGLVESTANLFPKIQRKLTYSGRLV